VKAVEDWEERPHSLDANAERKGVAAASIPTKH